MKIKFFLVFILTNQIAYSQEIKGKVLSINNSPIENANVIIWSSDKKETLINYVYTNENGLFYIKISPALKSCFIQVSCLDFASTSKNILLTQKDYNFDFVLETKENLLEEVIIKDDKAVRVKNDTTFYNPKKFLNGTERKVEDLIKKLPGMSVNEKTGEIKFKGKSIETVKLEDDDLFGGNYSIGTKNISVDMVEQVQAIENYSENPLLQGIESTDNVAINLKLKKQKTDYSGSSSVNNGFGNKILFSDDFNLLGISKKIKSFGIASYNNFGGGAVNIDSFSQGFNSSEIPERNFYAKKLISEPTENSSLPNNRTKLNNTVFVNYNLIYKLSKKISVKNNLIYFYDNSKSFEKFVNNFNLNNNKFETIQDNFFEKNASCFKTDLKLTYNLNKTSLLESTLSFSKQLFKSKLNSIQNDLIFFQNDLKTDDSFYKSKTNYTLRVNSKKALQFYLELSKNDIPQELLISPNNNFISGNFATNSVQKSQFSKQIFNYKVLYLESRNKLKQNFSLGFFKESNSLNSNLLENKTFVNGFKNNLNYEKSNLFWEYFSSINFFKIKILPFISSSIINQNLTNYNSLLKVKKTDLVYNGSLALNYKIKKFGSIFINGNFENKTPDEEFLYINKILENNNSLKNNIPTLDLIKSQNVTLGYKYYDLTKQFGFDLNVHYQNKKNTLLPNISISPNFVTATFFQNPANIVSTNVGLSFEKQIRLLRLYLKQSSTYSINNYKNAIDNFELRDNVSKNLNISTLIFSNFDFPINFDNKFNCNLINFESNNQFTNQRIAINNNFKIIVRPFNNWVFSITQDYFITDTKTNNNFNFIDLDIKYQSPKLKWLSLNFTGKNLLNLAAFTETNNSDYSTTIYSTSLLPRNFLVATNFNF